jgi:DNA repair exonuclease SbcCD ATPase subunit
MSSTLYAIVENSLLIGAALAVGLAIGVKSRADRRTPAQPEEETMAQDQGFLDKIAELEATAKSHQDEGLRWLASHKELEAQVAAAKQEASASKAPAELAEAAAEVAELKGKLGEIDQLHSELDSARGRSAELERKLADALASGARADAGGNSLDAAVQQVGVLTGKLGAAKDKIADLEAQVLAK